MTRSIGGDVVCHNLAHKVVAVCHHLVAEFVVVGDEIAIGAAEEFILVAVAVGDVAHSTILQREARLQGTTK